MKRFRFPLRPVSVIRAHREMQAREVFANAIHAYVQAEERLAQMRAKIAALEESLFQGRGDRYLADEALVLFRAYRLERQSEMKLEHEVIEARAQMQKRRSEYIESKRSLDAVNRLEDKARGRHRADALKAEQAQIDEFAGHAFARKIALT